MNNEYIFIDEPTSSYVMVPSPTVESDLITETDYVVYIPLATKNTYGTVKIGNGLNIDDGVISFDPAEVTIKSISKNGVLLIPDQYKHIDLRITASDVGLENVDNTSDMEKPVSDLQRIELDKKLDKHQNTNLSGKYLQVNSNGDIDFVKGLTSILIDADDWFNLSGGSTSEEVKELNFNYDFVVSFPDENKRSTVSLSNRFKNSIYDVSYEASTGSLSFKQMNGETITVDLPLELLIKSGYYDELTKSIILVLANDEYISIPVEDLIQYSYSKEESDARFASQTDLPTIIYLEGV